MCFLAAVFPTRVGLVRGAESTADSGGGQAAGHLLQGVDGQDSRQVVNLRKQGRKFPPDLQTLLSYNRGVTFRANIVTDRRGKMIEISLGLLVLIIILAVLVGMLGLSLLAAHVVAR